MDNKTEHCFKRGNKIKCIKSGKFIRNFFIVWVLVFILLISLKIHYDYSWKDIYTFEFLNKLFKKSNSGGGCGGGGTEVDVPDVPLGNYCELKGGSDLFNNRILDKNGQVINQSQAEGLGVFECTNCSDYLYKTTPETNNKCINYYLDPEELLEPVSASTDTLDTCQDKDKCTNECPCECVAFTDQIEFDCPS